jgi:hypothetical protein
VLQARQLGIDGEDYEKVRGYDAMGVKGVLK